MGLLRRASQELDRGIAAEAYHLAHQRVTVLIGADAPSDPWMRGVEPGAADGLSGVAEDAGFEPARA